MKRALLLAAALLPWCPAPGADSSTAAAELGGAREDAGFAEYFRIETVGLSRKCLADVHTLADWQGCREERRRQLQEMLGLWPWPERTPLAPVITGRLDRGDFTVEKLHFQALPRLYVTANLYLPKPVDRPVPAILYACGHSRMVTNGVSLGNKTGYQHHGEWFARNGYACLVIDTVQWGEILGRHWGTYREGQWWWNSRGYTPAGVEAWFGIRALDYLCSRPEVDRDRIGMTGRSGGGSYTWTVAALDERVAVAAPVAGITDLQNHVVDGAIEGHCDCMFFVNTYRWDFPQVAALLAPRPLLIGNTDKDRIFPLDGVVRLHEKTRRIYQLYGAADKLGLLITDGPHADTQDLQVPVFRWFNRFLKGRDSVIEMAAQKLLSPEDLRVFTRLPEDQVNTAIEESFVPLGQSEPTVRRGVDQERWRAVLREKVFAGWPQGTPVPSPRLVGRHKANDLVCREYRVESQPGIQLAIYLVQSARVRKPQKLLLTVLDGESWTNSPAGSLWRSGRVPEGQGEWLQEARGGKTVWAFVAPRGVAPARGAGNATKATQVRRRFMLLGQTLDSMRVWDIRCAVRALRALPELQPAPLWIQAKGEMGVNAAYAALFEPEVQRLELERLPASHRQGPDYLNVLRVWDIGQLLEVLGDRASITR